MFDDGNLVPDDGNDHAKLTMALTFGACRALQVALRAGKIDSTECYDASWARVKTRLEASARKLKAVLSSGYVSDLLEPGLARLIVKEDDDDDGGDDDDDERAAPPSCSDTMALIERSYKCWAPSRHWLFHKGVRDVVTNVLLVAQRLVLHAQQWTPKQPEHRVSDGDDQAASAELVVEKESAAAAAEGGGDADTVDEPAAVLPPEIWHFILSFVRRKDQPVQLDFI